MGHAAALCPIARFVDAVGYLEHGYVFTANMTGNTVPLGATVVKGDWLALSDLPAGVSFAIRIAASKILNLAAMILSVLCLIADIRDFRSSSAPKCKQGHRGSPAIICGRDPE